jgi:hypothetical protein
MRLAQRANCGILRLLSIIVTVENDMIKLPPGVHVPDGTTARITFESGTGKTLAERYEIGALHLARIETKLAGRWLGRVAESCRAAAQS